MGTDDAPHRLDGFDPDDALDELRSLRREITTFEAEHDWAQPVRFTRFTELFDLLDHWLIVGEPLPGDWAQPEPQVVAEHLLRKQPRRTTRAQRRG